MTHPDRRQFLRASALAGLGLAAGVSPLGARRVAPSDKIHVACIGVNGQGGRLLHTFADQPDVVVTHICDIDERVRGRRGKEIEAKTRSMPKLIDDYRTLLDDPSVDVFVVGTPDHWHALPTVHGCLHKKDVYVEKPDGHNIDEGKAMVAAARKYGRVVQLGTQSRSSAGLREAAEYVASGALGKVLVGTAWETARQGAVSRVPDGEVPPGVNYDLWLGPAPKRPFNARRFHGSWRWFFDYGTGDLGNDGVHRLDYCRWVMGAEGLPEKVSAAGGKFYFDDAQEWPDTLQVTYEYPGKILNYEMRIWSRPRLHGAAEGAAVYGENGWVLITNAGWQAFDGSGKLVKEGKNGDPLAAHVRNFLDSVRSRKPESLNQPITQGHVSSVLCHAGNIAWRTGKKLRLDPETERFDDAEANKYLTREYRKGFELPKTY